MVQLLTDVQDYSLSEYNIVLDGLRTIVLCEFVLWKWLALSKLWFANIVI